MAVKTETEQVSKGSRELTPDEAWQVAVKWWKNGVISEDELNRLRQKIATISAQNNCERQNVEEKAGGN